MPNYNYTNVAVTNGLSNAFGPGGGQTGTGTGDTPTAPDTISCSTFSATQITALQQAAGGGTPSSKSFYITFRYNNSMYTEGPYRLIKPALGTTQFDKI